MENGVLKNSDDIIKVGDKLHAELYSPTGVREITFTLVRNRDLDKPIGEEISTDSPLGKAVHNSNLGEEINYTVGKDHVW